MWSILVNAHCELENNVYSVAVGWRSLWASLLMQETQELDGFDPWIGKISWSRKWQSAPVFLLGKFHGQTNLVHYRPWGHKVSDTTEWSRMLNFVKSFLYTSVEMIISIYVSFRDDLIYLCICWDDCSWCDVSYWLICRFWTVPASLG